MFKRKKKKTGIETPTHSRFSMAPEPTKSSEPNPNFVPPPSSNFGYQPKSSRTKPPAPPTSGSNAVKPHPDYVPPASVAKPKQTKIEDTHRVQLYCTIDDLNVYIHKQLEGKGKYMNNVYVPIGATVNPLNLNVEIDLVAVNPTDSDYGRRIKLEVKL